MRKERWKTVDGFETYEVSDLGRVRRIGVDVCNRKSKVLKYDLDSRGYLKITLYYKGIRKGLFVHRLVAKAFLPNPKSLPEVNHLGENGDCRASKLEWRSKQGNMQHAVQTGRKNGNGVYFKKTTKKWVATYCPEPNFRKTLGSFCTKEKALEVRYAAIKSLKNVL
jgi:hypothetical protein